MPAGASLVGADLHVNLGDAEQDTLAQALGGVLAGAATVDQLLHAALEVEVVQARAALVEVLADLLDARVLELVVDERVHPLQDLATVHVVVVAAAHDSSSSPRIRPRSRA